MTCILCLRYIFLSFFIQLEFHGILLSRFRSDSAPQASHGALSRHPRCSTHTHCRVCLLSHRCPGGIGVLFDAIADERDELWGPIFGFFCTAPLIAVVIADTIVATTEASSAQAASLVVAPTGVGSTWVSLRMRPTRWQPSRRSICHLLKCGALCT